MVEGARAWRPTEWWLALMGLAVLAVLLLSAPAIAHDDLVSSTPADGGTVASAPRNVRLVFTDTPGRRSSMLVTDGCNRDVTGRVQAGNSALQAVVAGGEPGAWRVTFTVLSADGHAVDGEVAFTVRGRPDCAAPSEESEPSESTQDPGTSAEATPTPSATTGPAEQHTAAESADDASPWPWVAGIAGGVVLLGAVASTAYVRRAGAHGNGRPDR